MRHIIIPVLVLSIAYPTIAQKIALKYHPLNAIILEASAGVEINISNLNSIQFDIGLANQKVEIWQNVQGRYFGQSYGFQFRHYLRRNKLMMQGWYFSFHSVYKDRKVSLTEGEYKVDLIEGYSLISGLNVGFQFNLKKYVIDIGIGPSYTYASFSGKYNPLAFPVSINYDGITPKVTFSFGYKL